MRPKLDKEPKLYLRTQLLTGEVEGNEYSVSLNIDNKAVFIEFDGVPKHIYSIPEMIMESWQIHVNKGRLKRGVTK